MALILELPPEIEERLRREAARRGMDPGRVAMDLITRGIPQEAQEPSDEEWERSADELADIVDPNLAPLSDRGLSREGCYKGGD